jgi:hypothetical protein
MDQEVTGIDGKCHILALEFRNNIQGIFKYLLLEDLLRVTIVCKPFRDFVYNHEQMVRDLLFVSSVVTMKDGLYCVNLVWHEHERVTYHDFVSYVMCAHRCKNHDNEQTWYTIEYKREIPTKEEGRPLVVTSHSDICYICDEKELYTNLPNIEKLLEESKQLMDLVRKYHDGNTFDVARHVVRTASKRYNRHHEIHKQDMCTTCMFISSRFLWNPERDLLKKRYYETRQDDSGSGAVLLSMIIFMVVYLNIVGSLDTITLIEYLYEKTSEWFPLGELMRYHTLIAI